MKYMMICLIAAAVSYAVTGEDSVDPQYPESDPHATVVSITELHKWPIPDGAQAFGIDYIDFWYQDNVVTYVDCIDSAVHFMNADNGTAIVPGGWQLHDNNQYPNGVCLVEKPDADQIHINDSVYDMIFYKDYLTPWEEYNSLTDMMGKGMDYHAGLDKIFEIYTLNDPGNFKWFVAIYTPGFSTGSSYEFDCNISSDWYASGCCVFPLSNGNTGIGVVMYESSWIRFFEYPGHEGEMYYSHAVLPYPVDTSFGIAYADERDTFFHSYLYSSTYYISELEITEVNLERNTWGAIKAAF